METPLNHDNSIKPFALSLSKGFDKLSLNGRCHELRKHQ